MIRVKLTVTTTKMVYKTKTNDKNYYFSN